MMEEFKNNKEYEFDKKFYKIMIDGSEFITKAKELEPAETVELPSENSSYNDYVSGMEKYKEYIEAKTKYEEKMGFIDTKKADEYSDFCMMKDFGKLSDYEIKARGNIRWQELVLALGRIGGVVESYKADNADTLGKEGSSDIEIDLDTPSKVGIIIGFDQPVALGEDADAQMETLKNVVAEFLTSSYQAIVSVYNPKINDMSRAPSSMPIGYVVKKLKATALADSIEEAISSITIEDVSEQAKLLDEDTLTFKNDF